MCVCVYVIARVCTCECVMLCMCVACWNCFLTLNSTQTRPRFMPCVCWSAGPRVGSQATATHVGYPGSDRSHLFTSCCSSAVQYRLWLRTWRGGHRKKRYGRSLRSRQPSYITPLVNEIRGFPWRRNYSYFICRYFVANITFFFLDKNVRCLPFVEAIHGFVKLGLGVLSSGGLGPTTVPGR